MKKRDLSMLAIVLGLGLSGQPSRAAADPPLLQPPAVVPPEGQPDPANRLREHEALSITPRVSPPVHVDSAPPVPVGDRPGADEPEPERGAQWIEGYWDWDKDRREFVWVAGTWRVPPPGRFWVNGFWKRDEQGWTRVAGFWSERKSTVRRDGPPPEPREERIGPAPGPDYFYVPGQHVPAGDGVSWRPGFWARSRPGWEWVPARWVRLSDGWTYREGNWVRATDAVASEVAPNRDDRPTPGPTSPFNPALRMAPRDPDPNPTTDLQPLPDDGSIARGGDRQPLVPGLDPNPNPNPSVANPVDSFPPVAYPYIPPNLPITDVDIPGGLHIQVIPGQLPRITNSLVPFGFGRPRVSVGIWDPLRGPRQLYRGP